MTRSGGYRLTGGPTDRRGPGFLTRIIGGPRPLHRASVEITLQLATNPVTEDLPRTRRIGSTRARMSLPVENRSSAAFRRHRIRTSSTTSGRSGSSRQASGRRRARPRPHSGGLRWQIGKRCRSFSENPRAERGRSARIRSGTGWEFERALLCRTGGPNPTRLDQLRRGHRFRGSPGTPSRPLRYARGPAQLSMPFASNRRASVFLSCQSAPT